jgi:hypothetical protein
MIDKPMAPSGQEAELRGTPLVPYNCVVHNAIRDDDSSLHDHLGRSLWDSEEAATLLFADGAPVPPTLATRALCHWNDRFVTVLFEGRCATLRYAPAGTPTDPATGKTQKLWDLSDVFEFFVIPDLRNRSEYREFQVSPDGRWFDAAISGEGSNRHADTRWDSHSRFESLVGTDDVQIWKAGMEIPWTALDIIPRKGLQVLGNFYRATGKFHGDELMAWSPTGYGERAFHRTEKYGIIQLS